MGDELDALLDAFCRSPWGKLGARPASAENMCKRASLALLATLERNGIEARLWNVAACTAPEWGASGKGQHYIVEVAGEALDVTARQFDQDAALPLREPIDDALSRWSSGSPVDPDDPWSQRFTEYITARWRELPDVDPPGDEFGWPQPPGA